MLKDDSDIVKSLGYLALYAAYAEEAIDECISTLQRYQTDSQKNPSKFPTKQKINYIQEQINLKPLTQELQHFPSLLEYLIELFEERNKIIHGRIYGSLQGEADILRPGRPSGTEREITSGELIDLANQFFSALNPLNQAAFHSFHRYLSNS